MALTQVLLSQRALCLQTVNTTQYVYKEADKECP